MFAEQLLVIVLFVVIWWGEAPEGPKTVYEAMDTYPATECRQAYTRAEPWSSAASRLGAFLEQSIHAGRIRRCPGKTCNLSGASPYQTFEHEDEHEDEDD